MKTPQKAHANYAAYIAHRQVGIKARRDQRERELKSDPEHQEMLRRRAEFIAAQNAEKAAQEAEDAKHARVSCPYGFHVHVDRNFNTKASFLPYLERALRDYEADHPDQAPAPLIDLQQEAADRREAESRYRAQALETATSRARLESLLSMRCADMGQDELRARDEARKRLGEMAADPHGGEQLIEHQDDPKPTPVIETPDPEPVKRGRGRPPKFIADQRYEITPDGALLED
ncbi:hypothetical protein [Methylobacterium aquaticum]|uniref:hypothetical protein n=1 Tax=Methylobacterium aquaticum TaxID=270351 RepID=UPI00193262FD|nr:hypothetical protein [Methylobacterium aquaticum]QRE74223.1 hypothetical protein F1D61_11935 [Methylobacterium aquaticum]